MFLRFERKQPSIRVVVAAIDFGGGLYEDNGKKTQRTKNGRQDKRVFFFRKQIGLDSEATSKAETKERFHHRIHQDQQNALDHKEQD